MLTRRDRMIQGRCGTTRGLRGTSGLRTKIALRSVQDELVTRRYSVYTATCNETLYRIRGVAEADLTQDLSGLRSVLQFISERTSHHAAVSRYRGKKVTKYEALFVRQCFRALLSSGDRVRHGMPTLRSSATELRRYLSATLQSSVTLSLTISSEPAHAL